MINDTIIRGLQMARRAFLPSETCARHLCMQKKALQHPCSPLRLIRNL
jgi:hypothetical protein